MLPSGSNTKAERRGSPMHNFQPNQVFYYVTIKNKPYVEPDHTSYRSYSSSDTIFRLFQNREDAVRYAETVEHYEMVNPDDIFVASSILSYLLKGIQKEGAKLMTATGENLRLDACKMEPDSHPETLSVIYRYSTPQYLN